jgi:hypothetical protein
VRDNPLGKEQVMKKWEASVLRWRPFREHIRIVVEAATVTDAVETLRAEGYRDEFGYAIEPNWVQELHPAKGRIVSVG